MKALEDEESKKFSFAHSCFNLLEDYQRALQREKLKVLMASLPLTATINGKEYKPNKSKALAMWQKLGFLDLEKLLCESKIDLDIDVPVTYEWHKGIVLVGLSAVCGQLSDGVPDGFVRAYFYED